MNPIEERKKMLWRLFSLTGDDFVKELLQYHRGGETGLAAEIRERLDVEEFTWKDRKWYKMRSRTKKPADLEKFMYIHGGGFVLESGLAEMLFAEWLAEQTGAELWFPEYPLAPEATCVEGMRMITDLYEMMLKETAGDKIAIAGGSAGGSLALSLAIYLRENGLPQPRCMILLSPGNDLREPVDEEEKAHLKLLESQDTMMPFTGIPTTHKLWYGNMPVEDYRATPSAGDLRNLAPMLVFAGTGEVVNLSVRRLVKAGKEQGIALRYFEKELMPHCWIIFPNFDTSLERALILRMLQDPDSVINECV